MGVIAAMLDAVPGAEEALVVNNDTAALARVGAAMAVGAEIIVGCGELIEIGDGFRVPALIRAPGRGLCEVGSSNRTHLRLRGASDVVCCADCPRLRLGLLHTHPGLPGEPDASSWLRAGVMLVTASRISWASRRPG